MIVLAVGSLIPLRLPAEIVSGQDKVIHLFIYMPLGFLLSLPKIPSFFYLNLIIPLGIGTFYGAVMELLQTLVPGRTASFYDMVANFFGVGIGLILGLSRGLAKRTQIKEKRGLT